MSQGSKEVWCKNGQLCPLSGRPCHNLTTRALRMGEGAQGRWQS